MAPWIRSEKWAVTKFFCFDMALLDGFPTMAWRVFRVDGFWQTYVNSIGILRHVLKCKQSWYIISSHTYIYICVFTCTGVAYVHSRRWRWSVCFHPWRLETTSWKVMKNSWHFDTSASLGLWNLLSENLDCVQSTTCIGLCQLQWNVNIYCAGNVWFLHIVDHL